MSNNATPQTGQQRERNEKVEEDKTPRGPLQTSHGVTTIDENVVAKIAGMAAREVPGVYDDTSLTWCLSRASPSGPHLRFNERGSHERQQRER